MFTSAVTGAVLEKLVADGTAPRIRKFSASSVGMVLPGDELIVSIEHYAMRDGNMCFKLLAKQSVSGETVLEGEAEVEQTDTVYVFTGQGSQSKGMGMDLYKSSEVAKQMWDDIDGYLMETYGWSILKIVCENPKQLTVKFGGKRGRKLRQNYLDMTIETTGPNGEISVEPIIKGLTSQSDSYTFSDPRGLVFSTQFAQPAILLVENAMFADMRERCLVQRNAKFAGHSLGEYGSLSAVANFLSLRQLMDVVFYRGLAMQVAMERDEDGRSNFGMAAVNPGRVGEDFGVNCLRKVVSDIAQNTSELFEIVNYNVEKEQYVCAGTLRNLHTLNLTLDRLRQNGSSTDAEVLQVIDDCIAASQTVKRPIELSRGRAMIPLPGIDVPFHSSYLRPGVSSYRKFLQSRLHTSEALVAKLVDRFVPNVMAKPFSLEKGYIQEAFELTGSHVLEELLT